MKVIACTLFLLFAFCSCSNSQRVDSKNVELPDKITSDKLKKDLSPEEYYVLVEKGTENPFSGDLLYNKKEGVYTCARCAAPLFGDESKFNSGTGWPSFDQALNDPAIIEVLDNSLGVSRTEAICGNCGGHLGHLFNDGPTETGLRYCINSCSLNFSDEKNADNYYCSAVIIPKLEKFKKIFKDELKK